MSGENTMDVEQEEVIIDTIAPIPFEELKKYFQNDNIKYIVDIEKSELEGQKLLTYLGNLDIPIDLSCSETKEGYDKLFKLASDYLHFDQLVNIQVLEDIALAALYMLKGLHDNGMSEFIEDNFDILKKWERRIDQLLVYNLHTCNNPQYKEWLNDLPVDEDDSRSGINFVSCMKHESLYHLLGEALDEHTMFNPTFFNEPIFKGNNLFYYWAHENNPVFLFQNAISTGQISGAEYARIVAETEDSFNTL